MRLRVPDDDDLARAGFAVGFLIGALIAALVIRPFL